MQGNACVRALPERSGRIRYVRRNGAHAVSDCVVEESTIAYKKEWRVNTYLPDICDDLLEEVEDYMAANEMEYLEVAVIVMSSHLKRMYDESPVENGT